MSSSLFALSVSREYIYDVTIACVKQQAGKRENEHRSEDFHDLFFLLSITDTPRAGLLPPLSAVKSRRKSRKFSEERISYKL